MTLTSALDRDYVVEEGILLVGGLLGASGMLVLIRIAYLLARRPLRRRAEARR